MKAKLLLSGLLALGLSHAVSAGTIIGAKSVTSKTQSSVNNNPYTTINQSELMPHTQAARQILIRLQRQQNTHT